MIWCAFIPGKNNTDIVQIWLFDSLTVGVFDGFKKGLALVGPHWRHASSPPT